MRRAPALALLLVLAGACTTTASTGDRYPVEWFDAPDAAAAGREAIEAELAWSWPDAIDVRVDGTDAERVPVSLASCPDYLAVAGARVRAVHGGTTDAIFRARALACRAAALALDAQPSAVSHLRSLAFDEDLPDRLPWQVAMIVSGAEAQRIADERPQASWRDALFAPLTGYAPCGPHCGRYSDEGLAQTVRLKARGDFNGDDVEDLLLVSSEAATGGSYRAERLLLLTRRQPGGRIELLEEFHP